MSNTNDAYNTHYILDGEEIGNLKSSRNRDKTRKWEISKGKMKKMKSKICCDGTVVNTNII